MSSIITNKKYKIVLFQGGFADSGSGFDKTLSMMKNANSNFLVYFSKIDMSNFNTSNKCFYNNQSGYYTRSTQAMNDFKTLIANIVTFARNNENKTILVSTYLNAGFSSKHNFDSIENQKTKLVFIIDEIKKYSGIELSLVGHSQGGLVNLEASIARNYSIGKVISISTPYSPVYLGEKLIFIDFFLNIGGKSVYEAFVKKHSDYIPIYKSCVEKLCSSSYYSDLRNRWNNLNTRPKLTVITGTAGHLFRIIPGINYGDNYVPETLMTDPFDGLVKFSEQSNIQNANFIHLVDSSVPCYSNKTYAQSTCKVQSGLYISCTKKCPLKSLNLAGTIIDVLFNLIENAINGYNIGDLDNTNVMKAIKAARTGASINTVPSGYEDYYYVYSSMYGHEFIRYNSETIGHLLALLS